MAEGIRRPTVPESWAEFSRRAKDITDRFEVARGLSLALEKDWHGMHSDPLKHFAVHLRGDTIVVRCLSDRASGWHRMAWLEKHGFGGREVVLVHFRVEEAACR